MSWALIFWSAGLAVLAATNLLLWGRAAARLLLLSPALPDDMRRTRLLQLWLCAGYVLGCAFRSVLPVYDVPRMSHGGFTRWPACWSGAAWPRSRSCASSRSGR